MNVLISCSILVAFISLMKVEMHDSYRIIEDDAARWAMEWANKHWTETGRSNDYRNFFKGDIFYRDGILEHGRSVSTKARKWPNGTVPYVVDNTYSKEDKEIIHSAMAEFEKETCIKWIERTDEKNYVRIYDKEGCWSELGRIGGRQLISLSVPGCIDKGIIMHELMHALGFLHEHNRPDRDDYIYIKWNHIWPPSIYSFEKDPSSEVDTFGLNYDYHSIMHYGVFTFSKQRGYFHTLKPKDRQVPLKEIGSAQKKGTFTDLDVQKIIAFYECPGR